MKAIIRLDCNERTPSPSVNARISRHYQPGEVVEVIDSVPGDEYDNDDEWYRLSNGAYIWSGAADVQFDDDQLLPEDRKQFLVSYRMLKPNARPDLDTTDVPDRLYAAPVTLPLSNDSIRLNVLEPHLFVSGVIDSINHLPASRKHVLVYIHGWQMSPSIPTGLFFKFVRNYMRHPSNTIAKVIFLTWPAHDNRKRGDERALKAGRKFTENNLFESFTLLSAALRKKGMQLHLLVHSFGHQLLNGMLNPDERFLSNLPSRIFDKVFLMAPDITHEAATAKGILLENYFGDDDRVDSQYCYRNINQITNRVYVFHSKYDYLLYISTKKFVGRKRLKKAETEEERKKLTKDYRNLGNYGVTQLTANELNFDPVDLNTLPDANVGEDRLNFPFRHLQGTSSGRKIDDVWDKWDYDGINDLQVIFRAQKIPNHHRYLFTCRPVVDKVMELLD